MKYKILPHISELRLKVFGETIEDLFKNAAEALARILRRDFNMRMRANGANRIQIKIESVDTNTLLIDFLNEILAKSQINKCIYKAVSIHHRVGKDRTFLKAELIGMPVKRFNEDIKAVTYQDVNIEQAINDRRPTAKKWETIIVFDI